MPNVERDINQFSISQRPEREEFTKQRRRKETLVDRENLVPSRDLAWIIGVLSGGGYANPADKRISLDSDNEEFLREFNSIGEGVFGINSTARIKKGENNTNTAKLRGIVFQSKEIVETIGDLRRSEWSHTIMEQHKWILENSSYLWSFIEGVFERRGNVFMSKNRIKSISIGTDYINVANFLAELLVRLGVNKPLIEYNKRGKEGIKGVRIQNMQDIKHFAENIHSRIPEKEKRLSDCRNLKRYGGPRRKSVKTYSSVRKEEAIEQWRQSVNSALKHYEDEKSIQIRHVPKLHRESEKEAKKILEEIIMGTKKLAEPQVLFGPDDKSPISSQSVVKDHIKRIAESKLQDDPEFGTELYIAKKSGREILLHVRPKGFKADLTSEEVKLEATEFCNTFGRLSRKILKKLKRWALLNAIDRYPGKMRRLKVDVGLESSSVLSESNQPKRLSQQEIEEEALRIYQTEGRFTTSVLESLGRNDLIWAIKKHYHGRYKGLRAKLEIPEPVTNQRVDKKPSGYWNVEQIEKEGKEFYQKVGRLSHKSFKRANRQDLLGAIRNHYPGGLSALKERLGIIDEKPPAQ